MSSSSRRRRSAIARASSRKSPRLAGTTSETAAARRIHRFSDCAHSFSTATVSGERVAGRPVVDVVLDPFAEDGDVAGFEGWGEPRGPVGRDDAVLEEPGPVEV